MPIIRYKIVSLLFLPLTLMWYKSLTKYIFMCKTFLIKSLNNETSKTSFSFLQVPLLNLKENVLAVHSDF